MNATTNARIDPLPESMAHLPIDPERGYPVPWFVSWAGGKPEFRLADGAKLSTAVNQNRCWVCGRRHEPGRVTFVIGPMCAINRVSSEPPSHLVCARYSAKNCPFLARPQVERRGREEIAAKGDCAGFMIERNPGVTLLWTAKDFRAFGDGKGGTLFKIGDPLSVEFWSQGRHSERDEVAASVQSGLPLLQAEAAKDGPRAVELLAEMAGRFDELLDEVFPR